MSESSILLSNCTIWVEGITDRSYIAHWLRLLHESKATENSASTSKYKEDLHYSFVEYGGGNLTHWSFLDERGPKPEWLCGRLFLIADNDGARAGTAKALRHAKLRENLNDRFYLLPCREIENLLTPMTLRGVLLSYGEEESNLLNCNQRNYATKHLGEFLEKRMLKNPNAKRRLGSYAAKSRTVSDKITFAEKAIATMTRWEELSPDAQKLASRIYAFIEEHNQSTRSL